MRRSRLRTSIHQILNNWISYTLFLLMATLTNLNATAPIVRASGMDVKGLDMLGGNKSDLSGVKILKYSGPKGKSKVQSDVVSSVLPNSVQTFHANITHGGGACENAVPITYEDVSMEQPFITRWDLSKSAGSGATQIIFAVGTTGMVSYTWIQIGGGGATGSGTFSGSVANIPGLPSGGVIDLSISPTNFTRFIMNNGLDAPRLTEIKQWGSVAWASMQAAFAGCSNMILTATDIPNTAAVTNMSSMFDGCSSFNQPLPEGFNTTAVTDMGFMFNGCSAYNQPLPASFNTAVVTNMSFMFRSCSAYNQPLPASFNTASVTDMRFMFRDATAFNQSLAGFQLNANVLLANFLDNSGLSVENYDATLTSFRNQNVTGRTMGAAGLNYCASAADRANLVLPIGSGGKGWTITDGGQQCPALPFITRWDLSKSPGSGATQITFGVGTTGTVSYTWTQIGGGGATGSGTFTGGTATITGLPSGGIIDLSISPTNFNRFNMNNGLDRARLMEIKQWGSVVWASMEGAFWGCSNMILTATDAPNTAAVTNMSRIFFGCSSFNQPLPSGFNTAAVTTMEGMFAGCSSFNQPLPASLNTDVVTNMSFMFDGCSSYNQSLPASFNTAAVTTMFGMFDGCSSFNQPLPASFNTSAVTSMSFMFNGCSSFNQPLPTSFNTAAVSSMFSMFNGCSSFNQPLPASFTTAAVTSMFQMFGNATAFNQSLAGFQLNANVDLANFLDNSGLSVENYDATLTAFRSQNVTGRNMGAAGLNYCASTADRANLVLPIASGGKGWTINDGGQQCPAPSFITRWDLSKSSGSGATQISFGVGTTGTVSYTWTQIGGGGATGSGTFSGSIATITGLPSGGVIDLSISPTNFNRFNMDNGLDRARLMEIKQWGSVAWVSMAGAFWGCSNMTLTATDVPNTAAVANMRQMFSGCSSFNQALPEGFNTAAATNMSRMFEACTSYNQPLPASFNTAAVNFMNGMFDGCIVYNQPLPASFNTAAVTDMDQMFRECNSFNQPLPASFNTAAVTDMTGMFLACNSYNQPLPASFTTSAVTDMTAMFFGCSSYNQPLPASFNTAAVTAMDFMFFGCSSFNQPLPASFTTAGVTDMRSMFRDATAFNQSLAGFQLNANVDLANFLDNSGLSVENYDATLTAFNAQSVTGKNMGAIGLQYCASAADRANLVLPIASGGKGWMITGDVQIFSCLSPEINVKGNNVSIADGNTTPSTADHTDFGSQPTTSGNISRTFTIENSGSGVLNLIGTPRVSISGPNAADFQVTVQPNSPIAANNGTTTFTVVFDPSTAGVKNATISIANDDADENPYNFAIQGTGVDVSTFFITQWTYPDATTQIRFDAQTAGGPVNYTWTASPSGNSGVGSFTQTSPGLVILTDLNVVIGDLVTLSMEPQNLRRFFNASVTDAVRLTDVKQWGAVPWSSMENAFSGCSNLNISATDVPNLSGVQSMSEMFGSCFNFFGPLNIGTWNTSTITNMDAIFFQASNFNQPIGSWNTSAVTTMQALFSGASSFNQPLSNWNTALVTNMQELFSNASSFDQPIGNWNTAAVTNMQSMFSGASSFNQPIGNWNTGAVTNMRSMFSSASSFNQPIGNWDTGAVTNMFSMFSGASSFNQPISQWNTASVTLMDVMFFAATTFNQNIGRWTLNSGVSMGNMLSFSGMNCANYSATLNGWAINNPTVTGVSLTATGRQYGTNAIAARNLLTGTRGWTISGDSPSAGTCYTSDVFLTQWTFPTAATQIRFNAVTDGGTVNYTWTASPSGNSGIGSFTQTSPGLVTLSDLSISAGDVVTLSMEPQNLRRFYIADGVDRQRLTNVLQWGTVGWTSMENTFSGCSNLNITASDVPNLTTVTSMERMFENCTALNGPANIGSWNTSAVNTLRGMFINATIFNQNIGAWNTQSVTDMSGMFFLAKNFNQNIGAWNTQSVTDMSGVFFNAESFNQDIGAWNTQSVTNMTGMFWNALNFNQNIGNWNTQAVTTMEIIFQGATSFNQDISNWNTASVTNMASMFSGASGFNQNIGSWTINPNVNVNGMLDGSGMDCDNYSNTLIGWTANNPSVTGRTLGASGRTYNGVASNSRDILVNNRGWTITGDSPCASPDYEISTTPTSIVISDVSGNGDFISLSQNGNNLSIAVSPNTRLFSIDGGTPTSFSTPALVSLVNVQTILIQTQEGNDTIQINSFSNAFPSLIINGGPNFNEVRFDGSVTYASNRNLQVLNVEKILVNGQQSLSGSGTIDLDANTEITVSGSLTTAQGNITLTTEGGQDILVQAGISGINSSLGNTKLVSGRDIRLGSPSNFGDTRGQKLELIAERDILISNTTYAQADGAGGAFATAGQNITISESSLLNSNGGMAAIQLECGESSTLTINSGGSVGANEGPITIISDRIVIDGMVTTSNSVSIRPKTIGRNIDLGSSVMGQLSILQSDFNQINAGTIIIGNSQSGDLTISNAISRSTSTNIQLNSGGDLIFNQNLNTGGGDLALTTGASPKSVKPNFGGKEVSANNLSVNGRVSIAINGTSLGTFSQFGIDGEVNLTGVGLNLSGSHTPAVGQSFIIVENDGLDPVLGEFTGLSEGTVILNFLGSPLPAIISYQGGDGNDVVLTVLSNCTPITYDVAPTDACGIPNGGSITFSNVMGGTSPYEYSIDNGNSYQSVATFLNLAPGNYSVLVKDDEDCISDPTTIEITNTVVNAQISGSANLTCAQTSVTRTASGGTSYAWSNGVNVAMNTITTPGTYTVTVTSANGCTSTASTVVTQDITAPNAQISGSDNLTCAHTSVTRTASGGTSYAWSNGVNVAMNTITTPGTYVVTVTSANGCTSTASTVVTQDIAAPNAQISGSANLTCAQTSVTRTASGGTSYAWSNGVNMAMNTITTPGTYVVTVTSANGCTSTASTVVTQDITEPTPMISGGAHLTCTTTSVTRTATGGTSYAWSNGANTAEISVSNPGTYTVTVTSANGCTAAASTMVTQDITPPVTMISVEETSGTAANDGIICGGEATPVLLTSSFIGNTLWSTSATSQQISVTGAGTYTVTVTGSNGCTSSSSVTISTEDCDRIEIRGNGLKIANGTTSTSAADFTDFGTIVTGTTKQVTFTAVNISPAVAVQLTGNPRVTTDNPLFTVSLQPNASIPVGMSRNFRILFTASAIGFHEAEVRIETNDPFNSVYTFTVSAEVLAAAMEVRGNGRLINDEDMTPEFIDLTNFGSAVINFSKTVWFYAHNEGAGRLNLPSTPKVRITGSGASQFTVTQDLPSSINTGVNRAFKIRFTPTILGTHEAIVEIDNNDLTTGGCYRYKIVGTGLATVNGKQAKDEELGWMLGEVEGEWTTDRAEGEEEEPVTTKIYPNPSYERSYVELGGYALGSELSLRLLDAVGRLVWSKEVLISQRREVIEIALEGLSSGVYQLVEENRQIVPQRVIKVE